MRNPNGFGTVQRLSGTRRKPYAARVTAGWDGKRQLIKVIGTYATRAEAIAALADYNRNPVDLSARDITMGELFERLLKVLSGTLADGTIRGLKGAFNHCKHIHHRPYASIKAADMRGAMDAPSVAPNVRQTIRNLFRHLDRYAYELEIIGRRNSDTISVTAPPRQKEARPFAFVEIGRLWDNRAAPFVDIVLILLYSGWRIEELLEMKKTGIDLEAGTMKGGKKTRAGKGRIVPIHPVIYPLIVRRMEAEGGDYLLTHKGAPIKYNTFYKDYFPAVMLLIDGAHRIHDTRHTFRTALNRASAPISCVNEVMGHSTGDTGLGVYTHNTLEELRRAVELVDYTDPATLPRPRGTDHKPTPTNLWGTNAVQTSIDFQAAI